MKSAKKLEVVSYAERGEGEHTTSIGDGSWLDSCFHFPTGDRLGFVIERDQLLVYVGTSEVAWTRIYHGPIWRSKQDMIEAFSHLIADRLTEE